MKVDRADARPDPSAVDLGAETRNERDHQQEQPADSEEIAVLLDNPNPRQEKKGGDVTADPDRRPRRLERSEAAVETGDDDIAEAVEQQRDRKEDGVGGRRQVTVGEMGEGTESEHPEQEGPQVRGDRLGVPKLASP